MAFFNYATKEITLKVVYYGPGLSGKTTNLQYLYSVLDPATRGKFISLATEADRTLFFDFLPVDLGKISDFTLRFQLYTVPGQIRYNATRKLVLKGADAVVFVADSQREMREENTESFMNMRENLLSNNIDPDEIPVVLQYNKRDLPDLLSPDELNRDLNERGCEYVAAEAVTGKGVQETFEIVKNTLLRHIAEKHRVDIAPPRDRGISIKIPEKTDLGEILPETEEEEEIIEAAYPAPHPAPRPVPQPVPAITEDQLKAITQRLHALAESLSKLQSSVSVLSSEMNDTMKQQTEMTRTLREIHTILATAKEKRSWFRFSR